jgi:hypothetical protein
MINFDTHAIVEICIKRYREGMMVDCQILRKFSQVIEFSARKIWWARESIPDYGWNSQVDNLVCHEEGDQVNKIISMVCDGTKV